MKRAAYLCLCLIATLLALCLSACTSTRPATNRELAESGRKRIDATLRHGSPAPDERAMLPRAVRPDSTAARPGLLSGIGRIFSTPAGTAHRQAVRLARATGPRRLGKGAVYAPKATEVVNAYKPRAAVINADTGAIVTAIDKNKASAATAPGAVATTTTLKPGFPWGRVALGLGGVGLLVLLLATPVVPWLLAAFKRNRNNNANQA